WKHRPFDLSIRGVLGPGGCVDSAQFTPDGKLVAVGSETTAVLMWDVAEVPLMRCIVLVGIVAILLLLATAACLYTTPPRGRSRPAFQKPCRSVVLPRSSASRPPLPNRRILAIRCVIGALLILAIVVACTRT